MKLHESSFFVENVDFKWYNIIIKKYLDLQLHSEGINVQIAICDDNKNERDLLVANLHEYKGKTELNLTVFESGTELTYAIKKGKRFDLIFLDILMPDADGIETAKEIRERDKRVAIIFLTVSKDYALASYEVKARQYLLKPVKKEILFELIDEIECELTGEETQMLVIDTKAGLQRLRIDHLEYCEIVNRTIFYHMTSGAVIESRGYLKELEERLLILPCFIKTHRSYIVNINYIIGINSRDFVIEMKSLKKIPIPKANCGQIREIVHNYLEQAREEVNEKAQ